MSDNTDTRIIRTNSQEEFESVAVNTIFSILSCNCDNKLIGLSGGSTPLPIYKRLNEKLAKSANLNNFFWIQVDERLVSSNDTRSNQNMILQTLFKDNNLPSSNFIMAPVDDYGPEKIAEAYHRLISEKFQDREKQMQVADLLILGAGRDGHTASLFPDTDWMHRKSDSGYAVFEPPCQPEKRISMTIDRVLSAREVVFLVNDPEKVYLLEGSQSDVHDKPAVFVSVSRPVTWICNG